MISVVVSDTSPLNYLILIGEVEVLPRLFGKLLIPPAVLQELQHPKTPALVAMWARHLPPWIEVRTPCTDLHLGIGAGEDEAISLALELGNVPLIMDDRKACSFAEKQSLIVFGTITVLDLADQARMLDFEDAINRLRTTNFYIDSLVLKSVLADVRVRKRP